MATAPAEKFKTVDEYISAFPPKIKIILEQIRETIKQTVPEAEEVISYNMPAFKYHGILVFYAAHTAHIGFYPGSSVANDAFKKELEGKYKTSKGTVQFPFEKPIPLQLIKRMVKYRAKENLEKALAKKKK